MNLLMFKSRFIDPTRSQSKADQLADPLLSG